MYMYMYMYIMYMWGTSYGSIDDVYTCIIRVHVCELNSCRVVIATPTQQCLFVRRLLLVTAARRLTVFMFV